MKKTTFSALITLTIFGSMPTAHADFFGNLTDKVIDRVSNTISDKITNKAGDKAEEATDAVINPTSKSDTDAETTANEATATEAASFGNMGNLGDMMSAIQKPVTIDDQYTFPLSVRMEVTSDGKAQTLKQSMSDNAMYIEVDTAQSMVMDFDHRAFIMIDDKNKTKMPVSTDLMKQFANMAPKNNVESYEVSSMTKTGKTKKILGYPTEQWIYKDKDGNGEVWLTNSLDFDLIAFSKKMAATFGSTAKNNLPLDFSQLSDKAPTGYPLESIHFINGKEESRTKAIEVIEKPMTIKLQGYKMQSMLGQ